MEENKVEQVLDEVAKQTMLIWKLDEFKHTHSLLLKTIKSTVKICVNKEKKSILEALDLHVRMNEDDWSSNPQRELKHFIESLNDKNG